MQEFTEEVAPESTAVMPPLVAVAEESEKKPKKEKPAKPEDDGNANAAEPDPNSNSGTASKRIYTSAPLKELRKAEDMSIKELIEGFGTEGAYKISIKRILPEEVRDASGKLVATAGHLVTVDHPIDEDWIKSKFGGQKYELTFKRRNEAGRYLYFANKTISIAGAPILDGLVIQAPQSAAAPASESPTVVTKAMDMMASLVDKAEQRADRREQPTPQGVDPAMDALIKMMQAQLDAANRNVDSMRREMTELRTKEAPAPVVDTFKDKMLDKLIDGDSARIMAIRAQYESEIRSLKENSYENERRIRESFERDKSDARNAHEREIAMLRNTHESTMLAARQSHEIQLAAAKTSYETNVKLGESENRRLERDNAELRTEVKELRAKKDKSVFEQIKEVDDIKEKLGIGDGDEKSTTDKIIEAGPAILDAVSGYFKKATPPPVVEAAPQLAPGITVAPNGQRFMRLPNGKLLPVRRRQVAAPVQAAAQATAPAPAVGEDGQQVAAEPQVVEPPIPQVDPEQVSQLIAYFESAFGGGQDPEVVARSVKARMPEPVLMYLRDRVTEHGLPQGVDLFLAKVARLPSSSSLASQSGRNWIRKVGGALVED